MNSKFPKKRLSNIVNTFSGGTPSKNRPDYWKGHIGWISPKDIKEFYIHSAEDFISQEAIDDSATKLASKGSIVMVVRSGILIHTLPVSVLSDDFAINQDIKAIAVRDLSILPEYLAIFLKIFQERLLPIIVKHSTTVQSVNSYELLRVEVVCPPLNIQHQIIELFQKALVNKHNQEAQAQALLDSIDGYLLSELGVTLPPEPDNTIENRMFKTSWRQVSGGRFDPTFQNVVTEFKSSTYPSRLLRDVTLINPNTKFKGLRDEDEVTFVPMENVSEDGAVDTSQQRLVAGSKGYTTFAENDLLIAKITPCMENGKTGVARNLTNQYGYGSTEFHVFRPKSDELNIDFLHAFFHANFFRQNAKLTFGGSAGHQRVPPEFFKKMRIPVPPMPVQLEIVHEITGRQQQAQLLRQQAQRDFAEAKQEIERLILG